MGRETADIPWDAVAQVLQSSLFVAVILAIIAYFSQRKSDRERFERERKYDTMRPAFEGALRALRRYSLIVGFQNMALTPDDLAKKLPAGTGKEIIGGISAVLLMVRAMFLIRSGSEEALSRFLSGLRDLGPEQVATAFEKSNQDVFLSALREIVQANEDAEGALITLRLVGARKDIIDDCSALRDAYLGRVFGESTETSDLDKTFELLAGKMKGQLDAILTRSG